MRKLSANYVVTGTGNVLPFAIVHVSDGGVVLRVEPTTGQPVEQSGVEFYNGALVPGFVNAHCHLELSHMLGQIPEGTGLPGFIQNIQQFRSAPSAQTIAQAIIKADVQMQRNGIVAVGDIANGTDSLATKLQSPLHYHTFVEVFGSKSVIAEQALERGNSLRQQFVQQGLAATVVPHAPYSISPTLFGLMADYWRKQQGAISMHNQETPSENQLFVDGGGALAYFFRAAGFGTEFTPTGQNALASVAPYLPTAQNMLLVHNSFTAKADVRFAENYWAQGRLFWTLCPKANLYIEGALPNVPLLAQSSGAICLGTDSLASNHSLSILDELKTLTAHFPEFELGPLVQWATLNGAKALGISERYGSLEAGKRPGINCLSGIALVDGKPVITAQTSVRVLV